MGNAAIKRERQGARRHERLMHRQAKRPTPVEAAPDQLERLNRAGELHDALPLVLTAKAPANPKGLEKVAKVAQARQNPDIFLKAIPKADRQALAAAEDEGTLHPIMLERLLAPLNQAGLRAHVVAGKTYGPKVAIVVRIDRETNGVTWHKDLVVEGRLSDIQRALPDALTRERWAAAGVDVAALLVPQRMERA